MKKSKRLTEKVRGILFQGQSGESVGSIVSGLPSGVGDAIRGGAGLLGPSYGAAPGKGSSLSGGSSDSDKSTSAPLSIGYGWGMFVSPMLICTCPKCKHQSKRLPDRGCGDTSCPECSTKMKPFVQK